MTSGKEQFQNNPEYQAAEPAFFDFLYTKPDQEIVYKISQSKPQAGKETLSDIIIAECRKLETPGGLSDDDPCLADARKITYTDYHNAKNYIDNLNLRNLPGNEFKRIYYIGLELNKMEQEFNKWFSASGLK